MKTPTEFQELRDKIIEEGFKNFPTVATAAGEHKYDDLVENLDKDSVSELLNKIKEFNRQLLPFCEGNLPFDDSIDCEILKGAIDCALAYFEDFNPLSIRPDLYISLPIYCIYLLLVREFAPLEDRIENLIERLKKVGKLIESGIENLTSPPQIFTKVAIEITSGGIMMLRFMLPFYIRKCKNNLLKKELNRQKKHAIQQFGEYLDFLKKDLLPRSNGDFKIGEELFDMILQRLHFLPYSRAEMVDIGMQTLQSVKKELKNEISKVSPDNNIRNYIEKLKHNYPPRRELFNQYKKEVYEAKKFILEKDLVTIPSGESLDIVPTPFFERYVIPYAAYFGPAPLEEKQNGFFYVTPVSVFPFFFQLKEKMKGHSYPSIKIVAMHEAYPGHHLQFTFNNRVPSKFRRFINSTSYIEGWALYCEEMMLEEGYSNDHDVKIFQLKDLLWRAARVVVDIKLHTGEMKFGEAVDFLVNEGFLEKINAEKEVRRYTFSPTQPLSYLIGKKEIMRMRERYLSAGDVSRLNDSNGTRKVTILTRSVLLKEFHNKFLSCGAIPLKFVEKMIFNYAKL